MVFKKQENENGCYIDKDGKRYEILSCEITESIDWAKTGTRTIVKEDEEIVLPVYTKQVVINKGWDSFASLEEAEQAYGLTKVEGGERYE